METDDVLRGDTYYNELYGGDVDGRGQIGTVYDFEDDEAA